MLNVGAWYTFGAACRALFIPPKSPKMIPKSLMLKSKCQTQKKNQGLKVKN